MGKGTGKAIESIAGQGASVGQSSAGKSRWPAAAADAGEIEEDMVLMARCRICRCARDSLVVCDGYKPRWTNMAKSRSLPVSVLAIACADSPDVLVLWSTYAQRSIGGTIRLDPNRFEGHWQSRRCIDSMMTILNVPMMTILKVPMKIPSSMKPNTCRGMQRNLPYGRLSKHWSREGHWRERPKEVCAVPAPPLPSQRHIRRN